MSLLPEVLVDETGRVVGSPDGYAVGIGMGPMLRRMIWALPTNAPGGGMTRRYAPPWAPGETGVIGIDVDFVVRAPLASVVSGNPDVACTLEIVTNEAAPRDALVGDFVILTNPLIVDRRSIYATISGGKSGQDYQLRWTITDDDGNVYPRTGLLLCAPTS